MRLLFVHGAFVADGAWWWARMVAPLAAMGFESRAVELPSCGTGPGRGPADPRAGLHTDADTVRAALDAGVGPAVLVGHSYGGSVITDAAAGRADVAHLVYVAGVVPGLGESHGAAAVSGPPPPWIVPAGEGVLMVTVDDVVDRLLHDCDADAARGAVARLVPQSVAAFGDPVRGVAWERVPSTAVVCTADPFTPPATQRRWAARTGRVVDLPTGHHPFLSHPDLLAGVIGAAVQPPSTSSAPSA